ncbi:bifunctional sulfate adenylyltransferase/adenylylsulfate kinase [Pleionea mediterranea]|uniref:Adenylyl-sulfate kinase n=1 Tax=Pleionea mediterranea TaxID=523701 RepID=A0A316FQD8_9GAMM|nr:bifunctional sulfate adenylyltransferase/adenylylsulfate kinase [Pleionea mediterranea]PWK50884.1 sulfate adenylyltransferase [Pleionea mediterranea]
MTNLLRPHGGVLVELIEPAINESSKIKLSELRSWDLTQRQTCDLELLLNGGFSPLTGFLTQKDYESVLEMMRLRDGTLWPIPITLDVTKEFAESIDIDDSVVLRDQEGVALALLQVSDKWTPDKALEANRVYGTEDRLHPAVDYLFNQSGEVYLGGRITGLELPRHYDYKHLRDSPAELRAKFEKWGWNKVVAFQTRNPMHRAHQELTFRAAKQEEANLLIHPVVGMTKPGDIDHFSRVRCYEHILKEYPEQTTMLSLLPLAMRMGGPKEALWHAIIRKNYGCTHLIVGRDHAGPGKDSQGNDFYGPYDAQELLKEHENELGIKMVPFQMMVYVKEKAEYMPVDDVDEGLTILNISGTEVRRRLAEGLEIPDWFSYPDVVEELRKTKPPRHKQGVTIFFTGLSGAGKSTIANALMIKLLEIGNRPVTLLDGDLVRKHLSSELGFSKEHRNINIQRIGYVASEITKNGGFAICAPIAPYRETRREVRQMIEQEGGFIEIHVATSLEECERRDRKGLYAKARKGIIKEFTGISDPYEEPEAPELVIDTIACTPDEAAQRILLKLEGLGYIK